MQIDKTSAHSSLKIYSLSVEGIGEILATLPRYGKLKQNEAGLAYLDVDDRYITQVYPLLKDKASMPDYFGEKTFFIGAHISIFYPPEGIVLQSHDIENSHHFEINGICEAVFEEIKIYALKVTAPSLAELRRIYGLPSKLSYEGYSLDFHITVGTKSLKEGLC